MKRAREPFAKAGSPNSPLPSSSSAEKRGRQDQHRRHQQQQQQQQQQDHRDDDPSSLEGQQHLLHQEQPFQALLSEHGVVWPTPGAMAAEERQKRMLGFSCRCSNPSKLRLAVERTLVNDGARRSEFVEVLQ